MAKAGTNGSSWYKEYLASKTWKSIRRNVLRRDGNTCLCCGQRATQVHHTDYGRDVMSGSANEYLVSVCVKCHSEAEFDSDGRKRSLQEANGIIVPKVPWLKLFEYGVTCVRNVPVGAIKCGMKLARKPGRGAKAAKKQAKLNAKVNSLGYQDWGSFFRDSDAWKDVTERVLSRDGGMCQCCLGAADMAYQLQKDRRVLEGNGGDDAIVSVCKKCFDECRMHVVNGRLAQRNRTAIRQQFFNKMVAIGSPALSHLRGVPSQMRRIARKSLTDTVTA